MDLSEIEVLFGVIDDALLCILHTILFLRARQAVTPLDVECERLKPLTYPRISSDDVHAKVLSAIKNFKASLTRVGGAVKGVICVNFYVKVLKTNWVFQQVEDKAIFERWVLPVAVRQERPSSSSVSNNDSPSQSIADENRSAVENSLDHVQRCLMDIFAKANVNVDHVPDRDYSFELQVRPYVPSHDQGARAASGGRGGRSDMVSKLIDSKLPF